MTTDRRTGPVPQGPPPAGHPSDSPAEAAARSLADDLRSLEGDDGPSEVVEEGAGSPEPSVAAADTVGAEPEEPEEPAEPAQPVEVSTADADSSDSDGLAEAEAAISSDLLALSRERDEYLEALKRLQADFENYKKRMMRQQTATLERAAEDLVTKLLPVLDTLDLACRHGGGEAVEQVAATLLDVLGKEGLERLLPTGEPFDPNEHEAVAHQEGDGEPEVVDVLRTGYRWRGRLLRPAMVAVKG